MRPFLPARALRLMCALAPALLATALASEAHADPGDDTADAALLAPTHSPAPPLALASDDAATVTFDGFAQLQLSGLLGENVGLVLAPGIAFGDHALDLALFIAGGSHLRGGAELRYRLRASDLLSWWIGAGVAFDALFPDDDTTIWSRLTTFSTGLDVALTEHLYVGLQFSFLPRVAPLAVTFVETSGASTRQLEPTSDELLFDLADFVLHPGVALGFRL